MAKRRCIKRSKTTGRCLKFAKKNKRRKRRRR